MIIYFFERTKHLCIYQTFQKFRYFEKVHPCGLIRSLSVELFFHWFDHLKCAIYPLITNILKVLQLESFDFQAREILLIFQTQTNNTYWQSVFMPSFLPKCSNIRLQIPHWKLDSSQYRNLMPKWHTMIWG